MQPKNEREDITKIIRRLQDYQLWVDDDKQFYFDEKVISKNVIRCMISNDLDLETTGKQRQKLIDWCIDKFAEAILEKVKNEPTGSDST